MINRILIVNLFGIGDVLFSTPMPKILKRAMPASRIDFMCNERCQPILQNNRNIDDIIVYEKDQWRAMFRTSKANFFKELYRLVRRIRGKRYDLVIDLSLGYQIAFVFMIMGIKKRIGFDYRSRGRFLTDKLPIEGFNEKHAILYYLDILKLIGIEDPGEARPTFTLSPEDEIWAESFIEQKGLENKIFVGIAPGGGKSWGEYARYRRWDIANFAYVAKKLAKENRDIFFLLLGSEEECSLCEPMSGPLGHVSLNLCGKLSLSQSTSLINRCSLFICNDGGLLHTAVSQGVSTVSIFGPVNDKIYGPYPPSKRHKVVKGKNIECRPCYKNFKHKKCDLYECLNSIDRDEVLRVARESLLAQTINK
ncbi:MAG: glycosyltransferase family 9 protein [Candidatus Omnitrophota bacterium]